MKKIIALSLFAASFLVLPTLPAFAEEQPPNEAPTSSEVGSVNSSEPETAAEKTVSNTPARKKSIASITTSAVGLSTLQWNESLLLKQAGKSENDVANYSGLALSYQRETIYYHWGWNFGGFIGTGRANGGGNVSTITYQKDKQPFTIIGFSPRAFWRLTGRVNVGLTGLVYVRNVEWPSETAGLTVDATRNFTLTALADVNLRISDQLDFYQGIGPLDKGATFWKIGLAYRIQ